MKEYPKERYGTWAGNPVGFAFDPEQCAYETFFVKHLPRQCTRKPGHGQNNLFCKQHAKIVEKNGD